MRLNPQNVQNVVTYNVVIDVSNPEQKLKPGMTANLTVTIDERNDVLKVPNSALRFTPQTTDAAQTRTGNSNGSRRNAGQRQNAGGATGTDAAATQPADGSNTQQQGGARAQFARATEPVLPGQTRRVWVMSANGKPEPRRIKVGLSDGSATEVVEGDLREGDVVITGQNVTASSSSTQSGGQSTAPGFGGAPRTGGAGRTGGGGRTR
jgi:HlyD family secretion protein